MHEWNRQINKGKQTIEMKNNIRTKEEKMLRKKTRDVKKYKRNGSTEDRNMKYNKKTYFRSSIKQSSTVETNCNEQWK